MPARAIPTPRNVTCAQEIFSIGIYIRTYFLGTKNSSWGSESRGGERAEDGAGGREHVVDERVAELAVAENKLTWRTLKKRVAEGLATLPDWVANYGPMEGQAALREPLAAFLEARVERRAGRTYGPPGGKRIVFFLDDFNLPRVEEYGTQNAHALHAQLLDHGGSFFDRGDLSLRKALAAMVTVEQLQSLGINDGLRPENLGLADYVRIADLLADTGKLQADDNEVSDD